MESFKRIFVAIVLCAFSSLKANDVNALINTLQQYHTQLENGITSQNKNIPYTMVHQFYIPLLKSEQYPELKKCFDDLVNMNVLKNISQSAVLSDLDKQVFYFFVAEYLRLYSDNKEYNQLLILIGEKIKENWLYKPGKVWSAEYLTTKGKKERIENILNNKFNGDKSYYNAITDNELFLMASGTSLSISDKKDQDFRDIRDTFYKVLKNLVVFQDMDQWALQPNIWKDHPDYVSVRNNSTVDWDVSHFSRVPAYLNLLEVSMISPDEKQYVKRLRTGLASKFLSKVVQYNTKTKLYSFNNYMNGVNVSYRVNYKSKSGGYAPGGNYMHIFYGWWKLLNNESITTMYQSLLINFDKYSAQNEQINVRKEFYRELLSL